LKHRYLFSGLGADQRVFELLDLKDSVLHPIQWIMHEKEDRGSSTSKRPSNWLRQTSGPIIAGKRCTRYFTAAAGNLRL
jgi:hypothetical protein